MLLAGKTTNLQSRLEYLSADEVTPSIQENLDLPTLATDLSPYLNMSSSKVCLLKKEV